MAMTSINIRMDANTKQNFDALCNELGMTMSTAFNLFAKTSLRKKGIPFDLVLDPFYSAANMQRLAEGADAFANGDRGRPLTQTELEALGLNEDEHSFHGQSKRGLDALDAA